MFVQRNELKNRNPYTAQNVKHPALTRGQQIDGRRSSYDWRRFMRNGPVGTYDLKNCKLLDGRYSGGAKEAKMQEDGSRGSAVKHHFVYDAHQSSASCASAVRWCYAWAGLATYFTRWALSATVWKYVPQRVLSFSSTRPSHDKLPVEPDPQRHRPMLVTEDHNWRILDGQTLSQVLDDFGGGNQSGVGVGKIFVWIQNTSRISTVTIVTMSICHDRSIIN